MSEKEKCCSLVKDEANKKNKTVFKYWIYCGIVLGASAIIGLTKIYARVPLLAIIITFTLSTILSILMPDVLD